MYKIKFEQRPEAIQRVFAEEKTFMDFSKLCTDLVKGKVENYSDAAANAVILSKMRDICGVSGSPDIYEVRRAMNKTANREAFFEIIVDTVEDTLVTGWQASPFWNMYVDYKSYKLGQTNSYYVPDNTEIVVSELATSNHDITRQRLGAGREFSITVRNYGAKVYIEAERYLMGVEDWSALIDKISLAYTRLINTLLHDAVMSAGATLPSPTQWNLTCQMVKADRPKLIKLLSDVKIATGTTPVIMGTEIALSQLDQMGKLEYATMPNSAREEIYRTGRIGQLDQYKLVEIPQAFAPSDSSTYLVDDTKLLIMPGNIDKFVKFYDEGETQIKEVNDRNTNYDNTFEYELIRKFGIAVITNTRFGTVTIKA